MREDAHCVPDLDTPAVPDALAPDRADDDAIVVTRRRLLRLVVVACEAGGRFANDASGVDPVAWMLAPRRLLAGVAPIDACLDLAEAERAVLLLGLGVGLDADRAAFDELMRDDGEVELEEAA